MTPYRTLPLGLVIAVSAAPARHSSHAADALSAHPTELLQTIKESDYTAECFAAWKDYDSKRCWCHAGCALDCSQGGIAGTPGKDIHPQWCEDKMHASLGDCSAPTVSLANKCKGKGPGVAAIGFTARYSLPSTKEQAAEFVIHNQGKVWDDGHGVVYGHPAHDGANQRFFVEYVDGDAGAQGKFYVRVASAPDQCLDWHPDDNKVYMGGCHYLDNQVFYFATADGTPIKPGDSNQPFGEANKAFIRCADARTAGKVLDYAGSSEGDKLYFYDQHGNDNQLFYLNTDKF